MIPQDLSNHREQLEEAKGLITRLKSDGQLDLPTDPQLSASAEHTKRRISTFEDLIRDLEGACDGAKRKWLGELRSYRKIQNRLAMVNSTGVDLAMATNTLNHLSHQFATAFRVIRSLAGGVLPDPSAEILGCGGVNKARKGDSAVAFVAFYPKYLIDFLLTMGRYKFTGEAIQQASKDLLKLMSMVEENLSKKLPSLESAFTDAKELIEIIAKDMYIYPFDAKDHGLAIKYVLGELHMLIHLARMCAAGRVGLRYGEKTIQRCRTRLEGGPEFFNRLQEKRDSDGGKKHVDEVSDGLYIGVAPRDPNASPQVSSDSNPLVFHGPAELRQVSNFLNIRNGIFVKFSESHPKIPILKGLRKDNASLSSSGGYGDIYYLPHAPEVEHAVAVKVMKHNDVSRKCLAIRREAYAWSIAGKGADGSSDVDFFHNLLPLYGVCLGFINGDPSPALVSPWCEDGNLLEFVIKSRASLSHKFALLVQAAQGLEYLHTRSPSIVHGDLKASNVLIWKGKATLADFGIAKCLDGVKGLSPTGKTWYTACYRPPEMRKPYEEYPTVESDMYAFGATIFETLTESPPFWSDNESKVNSWIEADKTPADVECRLKDYPTIEDDHWKFMQDCFNYHQHDRPTIADARRRLEYFRDIATNNVTIPSAPSKVGSWYTPGRSVAASSKDIGLASLC